MIWQKLVAWKTSSSVPFLGSQSHCELVHRFFLTPPLVHPSPSLWPRLRPRCLPWAGPAASSFPPCSPCCQTFLPKLRFSRVRFMLGHKTALTGFSTRACVQSGGLSVQPDHCWRPLGLLVLRAEDGSPCRRTAPWKKGESRALPRAQFLLPKAPPVLGAVSAITVTTTITSHVVTISCHMETWSRRRRLPRPLTYLSSPLSIPHPPCYSHCSPPPPLGEGRHFSHLLSYCIVPFSQPALPHGRFLFVTHLSLKCHFPFKVFVYISPCLCAMPGT